MLALIPQHQPDQTLESFAAVLCLQNGFPNWDDAVSTLFGGVRVRINRPFPSHMSSCFEAIGRTQYSTLKDFIEHCSPLPLFKTFVAAESYRTAQEELEKGEFRRLKSLLGVGSTWPFHSSIHYCWECVLWEMRAYGYAYAHRVHQILGVETCPEHRVRLGLMNLAYSGLTAFHGLILPTPPSLDGSSEATHCLKAKRLSISDSQIRFSAWVKAAISGELPIVTKEQRLQAIRARLASLPVESGVPIRGPTRLQHLIVEEYDGKYLSNLGLNAIQGSTAYWPALFYAGRRYAHHVLANLLVLNALFRSCDAYRAALDHIPKNVSAQDESRRKNQRATKMRFGVALAKDIRNGCSVEAIAHQHDTTVGHLDAIMRRYPAIERDHRRANASLERARARHAALRYIATNARPTRDGLSRYESSSFNWLVRRDVAWLERMLPSKRRPKPQEAPKIQDKLSHFDSQIAGQLQDIVNNCHQGVEPIRITKRFLKSRVEPRFRRELRLGHLPLTSRAIDEFAETAGEYQQRILDRLVLLLSQGDRNRCLLLARHFLRQFSYGGPIIEKVVAALLGGAETAGTATHPNGGGMTLTQKRGDARQLAEMHTDGGVFASPSPTRKQW